MQDMVKPLITELDSIKKQLQNHPLSPERIGQINGSHLERVSTLSSGETGALRGLRTLVQQLMLTRRQLQLRSMSEQGPS